MAKKTKKKTKSKSKLSPMDQKKARLKEVWNSLIDYIDTDDVLDETSRNLEEWLDTLHGEDYFGTEGQCDPRGDGREVEHRPRI